MTKLSNFWYETETFLPMFISDAEKNGAAKEDVNKISTWWTKVSGAPLADFKSKLDSLSTAKTDADKGASKSDRSARLLRIIQGAVGASASQSGVYGTPADLILQSAHKGHTNDTAGQPGFAKAVRDATPVAYFEALSVTVAPARTFLEAAKGVGSVPINTLSAALTAAVKATEGKFANPLVWNLGDRLATAIRTALPKIGGGGEGSAFWPSTWVSSSSGS